MKELSTSRAVPTSPPWAININKPSYSILKVGLFKYTRSDQKVYRFYYCKKYKIYKLRILSPSVTTHLQPWKSFSVNTLCSFVAFHVIITCTPKLWNDLPFSRFLSSEIKSQISGERIEDAEAVQWCAWQKSLIRKYVMAGALSCSSQPLAGFIREHRMQLLCSLVSCYWPCGLLRRISSHNRSNTNIIVAYSWVRLTDWSTYKDRANSWAIPSFMVNEHKWADSWQES